MSKLALSILCLNCGTGIISILCLKLGQAKVLKCLIRNILFNIVRHFKHTYSMKSNVKMTRV